jgi:biotin carboxyl carrier protein
VRFEVETGRRRRTIDVKQSGSGWAVTVDGRPLFVDFVPTGAGWSMLVRKAEADERSRSRVAGLHGVSREVAIESRGPGPRLVHVDGHSVLVTLHPPGRRHSRSGDGGTDSAGPVAVLAPMPGRVVKVLVTPGSAVVARQGLVVVEAMKMENELRAPRAGTVAEVRVREGAPVDANAVLVVIT